eukprot:CAMPEP_0181240250 /NCGR_PEP_ID=MMETSP1096-20121128/40416_1 /TAXON_ID=156174 ORGANISM="Chrysochromulina ericina, Strain CCMP281" /NCGR_SAMPLE_ID=MMETSP1096 /ASSEMBLY_ACC=CAM_ASM_000453 /LENGTH=236 /DNA_ID=CAMNT_0023336099 /DNA_START=18 /DNA_END=729 /DNA_ORIENTATION=-
MTRITPAVWDPQVLQERRPPLVHLTPQSQSTFFFEFGIINTVLDVDGGVSPPTPPARIPPFSLVIPLFTRTIEHEGWVVWWSGGLVGWATARIALSDGHLDLLSRFILLAGGHLRVARDLNSGVRDEKVDNGLRLLEGGGEEGSCVDRRALQLPRHREVDVDLDVAEEKLDDPLMPPLRCDEQGRCAVVGHQVHLELQVRKQDPDDVRVVLLRCHVQRRTTAVVLLVGVTPIVVDQ